MMQGVSPTLQEMQREQMLYLNQRKTTIYNQGFDKL